MKTLINILILLIFNVNLVFGYQVYSTAQQHPYKIGYTTNYSNGSFTPSAYQHKTTQYQSTYKIGYTTNYSNGTFTPSTYKTTSYSGGNTYNPGGARPRRITVYNGQGDSKETPGGNNDDPNWLYKYDDATGKWYCSDDGGTTWYEWRSASGFWEIVVGIFGGGWGNDWRSVNTPPGEDSSKWASDPNDPFLQPIGDGIIPLSLLMLAYLSYTKIKKRRESKH